MQIHIELWNSERQFTSNMKLRNKIITNLRKYIKVKLDIHVNFRISAISLSLFGAFSILLSECLHFRNSVYSHNLVLFVKLCKK